MNTLYNRLKWCLEIASYNVAPLGENTIDDGERTMKISISDLHPLQQYFNIMETTVTFTFINGNTWEDNANFLKERLISFIPREDRSEEYKPLADYSERLTLLDEPEITDIVTEADDDTGEISHSVTVTFPFIFTN